MQDEYLTPAQIAAAAGVTYHTVLNAIKDGKLVAMQFAGAYAIRRSDALAYIATGGEDVTPENIARLERQLEKLKTALAVRQSLRAA